MAKCVTIGTILLALIASTTIYQSRCSASTFYQSPSNTTVCQGNVATFNCSSSNVLGFIIDGIDAAVFIANQSETVTSIITISNGQYLGILSVPGNPKYDQLSIVCRAFGSQAVDSMTAVLHVLSSPSNLTVLSPGNGTLILNWSLPASMLAPPLQLYAVEVRNQSNVVLYSTTMATPGPIPPLGCRNYTISVAPVCPTSKGTAAVYTFSSDLGPGNTAVSYSVLQNCSVGKSCFDIVVFVNCAGQSYTLRIPSVGTVVHGVYLTAAMDSIFFSAALPRGMKYSGQMASLDNSTFNVTISTFDVQAMTASADGGVLLVTCVFAPRSLAKGCLLLAMGPSSVQYQVIRRSGLLRSANQTLAGLAPGSYDLMTYDIYEDGSLSSGVASEITGLLVTSSGPPPTIGYSDIDLNSTLLYTPVDSLTMCLYCVLKYSSTIKGCALVVRQLGGATNVTLMTVLPLSTSCYTSVSPGNYTAAVFDWEADGVIGRGPFWIKGFQLALTIPVPTSTPNGNFPYTSSNTEGMIAIIAGTCAGAGVLIFLLVLFVILGAVHHRRRRGFAITHDDDEKKYSSEQKTDTSLYEHLQGTKKVDTRIPPAVPPPRTTSDRSLNLRVASQPDEGVELMTLSSRSSETTERTDVSSPDSTCQSETSVCSQRTEPQYQIIPENSNLFIFKASSVSLQNGISRSQPKYNNRRHTASLPRPPAFHVQSTSKFMEATAV